MGTEGLALCHSPAFPHQPALDGLRAVAVLAVIAYHLGYGWARGGFLGVDTFFVLSGTSSRRSSSWSSTGPRRIDLRAFWARRARRLLPALLLVLGAVTVWAALVLRPDQLGSLRGDGLATLFYGANWRFVASGQSYFDVFSAASPLRHAWSLAIEEQFYLVWPLIAFACLRLARGRTRLLGAFCIAGAAGSIVLMASLYDPADPSRRLLRHRHARARAADRRPARGRVAPTPAGGQRRRHRGREPARTRPAGARRRAPGRRRRRGHRLRRRVRRRPRQRARPCTAAGSRCSRSPWRC